MFNLFPISLLIMALGGIVYIVSNHLSEFNADEEKNDFPIFDLKALLVGYINRFPIDNVKNQSLLLIQKLLHRTRLSLLKIDNHLMKLIGRIAERDKIANGNQADFWEDLSRDKQEKENIALTPIMPLGRQTPEIKIDLTMNARASEKFFDVKLVKKSSFKNKKIKNNANVAQSVEQLHGKE